VRSKDFENLKYCTDLVALDIGHCTRIGDIDFIATIPNLRILVLSLCDLTDISVLETQPNLEFLELNYNYVSDISVIAKLQKLKYLNLSNNEITSYDALLALPVLERLWMSCSGLTDRQLEEMDAAMMAQLPDLTIRASNKNKEFAMSYWRKDNPAYLEMQALFGLRAQHQGTKKED
jgi:Leucine-rich repeat (LRR) protein